MDSSIYSPKYETIPRSSNKRIVLDMIRFTPGGISRAELARQMGLTRSAITTIVNDLFINELVRESDNGPTTGGRRPVLLDINPDRGFVVGIDMGFTYLGLLLADLSAQVLLEKEYPFDVTQSPTTCLDRVDQCLGELLAEANLNLEEVMSIGLGVPGPVIMDAGKVISPPIMPGWDDYPIQAQLKSRWRCPVSVNNDAELGALGEWAHGAGRGEDNLVYIKVGSGVGAGLLLNGKIFHGASGSAGEIGHITIRDDGPLCTCGNHGCLEAMAGGLAIAKEGREAVLTGRRTQLANIQPTETITAHDVSKAARMGDLVAQQIMTEAGNYLGIAIASLVNLINPGMVVVGGGVAQMGDLLLQPIRQVVRERSLRSSALAVQINSAVLGRRSSSMGAVVQAVTTTFDRLVEI
jgi:glucokinase-like ROK family protein